jgi:lipoprotein-releasing system permease protein
MRGLERFISRRHLFRRERGWLVTAITVISVVGVAVGVAALIMVLAIIEGIDREIFGQFVEVFPHVRVTAPAGGGIEDPAPVLEALAERSEVAMAEAVIRRQVLFERLDVEDPPQAPGELIGVEMLGEGRLFDVRTIQGDARFRPGEGEVVMGLPLAVDLHFFQGHAVRVYTSQLAPTQFGYQVRARDLKMAAAYNTRLFDFDSVVAFVSMETARDVFGADAAADYIHVKLKRPYAAAAFKRDLSARLPDFAIATWEEENGAFVQALKLEKLGLTVIVLLVVIVAGFSIVGTLILTVMEKKREIGIMKAFGASERLIQRIFLTSGMTIGAIGGAIGLALGLLGCLAVRRWIRLSDGTNPYGWEHLPIELNAPTVAAIAASALIVSLAAAVFPARQAARLDPIEALRED